MNVKRKLADALLALCNRKPLDYVTVTEIAQEAKLTRQVFYKYFMDKYELANWIQVDDYYSALQKNNIETMNWCIYVEGWLSLVKEHKSFYQNIYYLSEKEFLRLFTRRNIDFYSEIMRLRLQKELNVELQFSLELYCQGGCEKIVEWIMGGMTYSPNQMCQLLYASMPDNIRTILADQAFPKEVIKEILSFRIEKINKL